MSYHMEPHREWFYEYENFNGNDILMGYYSVTKIVKQGKVWFILKDGRIGNIPRVLDIPGLAWNMICISNMGNAGVQYVFENYTWRMVRGALVLMKGV